MRMKCAVANREQAEQSLKRAMASLNYIEVKESDYLKSLKHIERSKELIISGNIILKAIRDTEHIGELYNESFDDVIELFDSALREAQKVLILIESLK